MVAQVLGAILIALAILGILDSLYFVLVAYGRMRPDPRWMPNVCRMDDQTCAKIIDTPYGRLFGVPNAVPGLLWYLVVLGAGVQLATTDQFSQGPILIGASVAVLGLSLYLVWALIRRLRTVCVLCYLAHAINVLVVALFVIAYVAT